MLIVDVLVILILVAALAGGLARGFFASIGTLLGLAAGGVAAFWLTPLVSAWVPTPGWRTVAVLVTVGVLLAGGAAVGSAIGAALRGGAERLRLGVVDRLFGGVAGVVIAALALVLAAPAVTAIGMPGVSSAVASSRVIQTIDILTPPFVDTALAELRSTVIDDGLPRLGGLLAPDASVDPAPPVALDDPALQTAAASVARVSGTAFSCGRSFTGSGFVVSADRVVTNAHVVAGVETPVVELPGIGAREGRIVYFDAVDDLAVIAVDDLGVAPLVAAPTLGPGAAAAALGYPLGGPFTSSPASVLSVATVPVADIYGERQTLREVYSLQASVRPGNSGGPLVTADGRVAGVVFARAEDDAERGYAMTTAELAPVVERASSLSEPVSSGTCVL
ncbi:MAG: MarP family serine protease [Microbacterium sp.]